MQCAKNFKNIWVVGNVSIPQAVGTIAIHQMRITALSIKVGSVSIPQAVGTIAIVYKVAREAGFI